MKDRLVITCSIIVISCSLTSIIANWQSEPKSHEYQAPAKWGKVVSAQGHFWGRVYMTFEDGTVAVFNRDGTLRTSYHRQ